MTTPSINKLYEDETLQEECVKYVTRPGIFPSEINVRSYMYQLIGVCMSMCPHSLCLDDMLCDPIDFYTWFMDTSGMQMGPMVV